jgi:hypothetical protein
LKTQRYRIFDQEIELRSDHADTLAIMDVMFRRFAVADNDGEALRYDVLTKLGGRAGIHTKDFTYIVEQPSLLPSQAHGIILRHTLRQIRSHLLFHAAALSRSGKGIILAADSGCGKTTLTLALVRQGFKMLSDETAALSLSNGELAPYPRCLWVRAGTHRIFQQIGWDLPSHQIALKKSDRTAIHLSAALMGNNCQPRYLIITQRPDEGDERICDITLDTLPDRLWADLQARGIEPVRVQGFPVFKAKEKHMNKIYDACEQHNVLVLDVEETAVAPSYYENTPQLQEISKLTAAISLLRYFLGSYRSVIVQHQGSAAGLIQPLVKILAPVKCYKLTPGKLEQTVEIINDLC